MSGLPPLAGPLLRGVCRERSLVIDPEMREVGGARQTGIDAAPVGQQFAGRRNLLAPAGGLLVAVLDLFDELQRVRVHLVAFRHDDPVILGPRQILEERRVTIGPPSTSRSGTIDI